MLPYDGYNLINCRWLCMSCYYVCHPCCSAFNVHWMWLLHDTPLAAWVPILWLSWLVQISCFLPGMLICSAWLNPATELGSVLCMAMGTQGTWITRTMMGKGGALDGLEHWQYHRCNVLHWCKRTASIVNWIDCIVGGCWNKCGPTFNRHTTGQWMLWRMDVGKERLFKCCWRTLVGGVFSCCCCGLVAAAAVAEVQHPWRKGRLLAALTTTSVLCWGCTLVFSEDVLSLRGCACHWSACRLQPSGLCLLHWRCCRPAYSLWNRFGWFISPFWRSNACWFLCIRLGLIPFIHSGGAMRRFAGTDGQALKAFLSEWFCGLAYGQNVLVWWVEGCLFHLSLCYHSLYRMVLVATSLEMPWWEFGLT
jgi:hypothetical protein